jgi:hypothetical protein
VLSDDNERFLFFLRGRYDSIANYMSIQVFDVLRTSYFVLFERQFSRELRFLFDRNSPYHTSASV